MSFDGPIIYFSTTGGISAYHVRAATRIFSANWPKNVMPVEKPAVAQTSVNYLPQGRFRYGGQQYALPDSIVALVADGVFYTEVDPGRLVALADEEAK